MLVTDDAALFERVQVLRDHGRRPGDQSFHNLEVAFKYKMSSLQAALGLAQLERMGELLTKKRQIFAWYRERLAELAGTSLNAEPANTINSYWMVTAIFSNDWGGKERVIRELAERGVASRPFFSPLSSLPAYDSNPKAATAAEQNATSYRLGPNGVNLPSALLLTEAQVERVCECLREIQPT
jgi:perosamine synthetase